MKIYHGLNHNFPFAACALTIGNFDGVHLGHRHLLQVLTTAARQRDLPTVLMTFEPMPREFFAAGKEPPPYRIAPLLDKINLIAAAGGVDYLIIIDFNQEFAAISPRDFVENILIDQLHAGYLLIGDDFKFGSRRGGDVNFLRSYTQFSVEQLDGVCLGTERISSSVIRAALLRGDFAGAARFLGHEFFLSGEVYRGRQLGRKLNCPTANINLNHHFFPLSGVYIVTAAGSFGDKIGAASFGVNPTVSSDSAPKLEVHILDFTGELYGETLRITFKKKIRDEHKFSNIEDLSRRIAADIAVTRAWGESSL